MAFFMTHTDLEELTCRSKKAYHNYRKEGKIPYEKLPNGKFASDIDDPKILKLIRNPPRNASSAAKERHRVYVEEFDKRRARGDVVCAKTGEVDYMAALEGGHAGIVSTMDDDLLDRQKKEAEIAYKNKQVEKIDVALKALTGDLIDRTYVETWIRRYVGNMHQQVLDLVSTGIMDDIYSTIMRHSEEDAQVGIKAAGEILEKRLSQIIKDSVETMRRNNL